jgi:proline iminopeptidase/L-proline amide hydrolase
MTLDRRSLLTALSASAIFPLLRAAAPWEPVPAPDREEMVPVEGGKIYVRMNGRIDPARPPVLFVHGGPGGSHSGFAPLLPLADDRAVLLYDQLDCGRSDHPQDPRNWRVARFVDEVDAIRSVFGLDRLHVCGHSWGGTIALEYAARRPRGLASAILASPLVSTRSWIADANLLRKDLPAETQTVLARCETATPPPAQDCDAATEIFYDNFMQRGPTDPDYERYRQRQPRPFNARLYETMWGRTEFTSTGTLRDYDGEPLLAKLDGARTLFVAGQYDEARPATIAGFARRVPGAEYAVVPGSGHALMLERPAEVIALLRGWLARHDAA